MQLWTIWEIIGISFLIAEMFTPTTFLAGLGIGAIITGLCTWLGCGIFIQLSIFAIVSILFSIYLRPMFKNILFSSKTLTNFSIYEDKQAKVIQTINNNQNQGRIRVFDEEWEARSIDNTIIEENSIVKIKYINSMTMYVITE